MVFRKDRTVILYERGKWIDCPFPLAAGVYFKYLSVLAVHLYDKCFSGLGEIERQPPFFIGG